MGTANMMQHHCRCGPVTPFIDYKTSEGHYSRYCMRCNGLIGSFKEEITMDLEAKPGSVVMTDDMMKSPVDQTNPKDRLGVLKPRVDLIPPASLIYQALAMQFGAVEKPIKQPDGTFTYGYGPFNWRAKKVRYTVYLAAILRHYLRLLDGCDVDDESKYPEIGHLLASGGILADAIETGNIIDDRPPKGAAASLLAKWTKTIK